MEAVEVDVFEDFGEVDEVGGDGLEECILTFWSHWLRRSSKLTMSLAMKNLSWEAW